MATPISPHTASRAQYSTHTHNFSDKRAELLRVLRLAIRTFRVPPIHHTPSVCVRVRRCLHSHPDVWTQRLRGDSSPSPGQPKREQQHQRYVTVQTDVATVNAVVAAVATLSSSFDIHQVENGVRLKFSLDSEPPSAPRSRSIAFSNTFRHRTDPKPTPTYSPLTSAYVCIVFSPKFRRFPAIRVQQTAAESNENMHQASKSGCIIGKRAVGHRPPADETFGVLWRIWLTRLGRGQIVVYANIASLCRDFANHWFANIRSGALFTSDWAARMGAKTCVFHRFFVAQRWRRSLGVRRPRNWPNRRWTLFRYIYPNIST